MGPAARSLVLVLIVSYKIFVLIFNIVVYSVFLKRPYIVISFKDEDGSFPIILREVNVPIVGNSECQCYYEGDKVITENMICAGIRAGGKDSFWVTANFIYLLIYLSILL